MAIEENTNINEFIENLFEKRFAAKGYDPERAVSERDWKTILHAAHMSPTSMGIEPWAIVRLQDQETLDALLPVAPGAAYKFPGSSHNILLLARKPADLRADSAYIQHIYRDVQGLDAQQANEAAAGYEAFLRNDMGLQSDAAMQAWAARQTYIVLANMLTTAAALGIDSSPIEGFNVEAATKVLTERGVFDPEHFTLVAMAAFGYANVPALPKRRRPFDEVYTEF